jgi:hypothetical protein
VLVHALGAALARDDGDVSSALTILLSQAIVALAVNPRRGCPASSAVLVFSSLVDSLSARSIKEAVRFVEVTALTVAESIAVADKSAVTPRMIGGLCTELHSCLKGLAASEFGQNKSDSASKVAIAEASRAVAAVEGLIPSNKFGDSDGGAGDRPLDDSATAMLRESARAIPTCT